MIDFLKIPIENTTVKQPLGPVVECGDFLIQAADAEYHLWGGEVCQNDDLGTWMLSDGFRFPESLQVPLGWGSAHFCAWVGGRLRHLFFDEPSSDLNEVDFVCVQKKQPTEGWYFSYNSRGLYPRIFFGSRGFFPQVLRWGDGMSVPTSGDSDLIIGTDDHGVLHMRIFNDSRKQIIDTDESQLAEHAKAIKALKKRLKKLSPPFILTDKEQERLVNEVAAMVGLTDSPRPSMPVMFRSKVVKALIRKLRENMADVVDYEAPIDDDDCDGTFGVANGIPYYNAT